MLRKNFRTLIDQFADNRRTKVSDLFVHIGYHLHCFQNSCFSFFIKKSKKQSNCFVSSKNLQFVSIFNIHYLITNIVGSLNQIHQWITCISVGITDQPWNAQFSSNSFEIIFLGIKEPKLLFPGIGENRSVRIFHYRGKRTVGENKSSGTATNKLMRKQSESIGISFKAGTIFPFFIRHFCFEMLSVSFREEGSNGLFARMTKRRIAQIVCQASCRNNRTNLLEVSSLDFLFLFQPMCHIHPQRSANTGHFQAMRQAVVHKHASGQWKYLRFIL